MGSRAQKRGWPWGQMSPSTRCPSYPAIRPTICLSIYLPGHPTASLSIACPSLICPSIRLSIGSFICPLVRGTEHLPWPSHRAGCQGAVMSEKHAPLAHGYLERFVPTVGHPNPGKSQLWQMAEK